MVALSRYAVSEAGTTATLWASTAMAAEISADDTMNVWEARMSSANVGTRLYTYPN